MLIRGVQKFALSNSFGMRIFKKTQNKQSSSKRASKLCGF